jgi:hypothetical protein
MHFAEQRLGDAPSPRNLVGALGNGRREFASHFTGSAQIIHRVTPPLVDRDYCGRSLDRCQ